MISFLESRSKPGLPAGYILETQKKPQPLVLNRLLSRCGEETFSRKKLFFALERSIFCLSIVEESTGDLVAFVRATSDLGLNANLWNLVAEPCELQGIFLSVLVHKALVFLKRDVPGCSISIAASSFTINSLKEQGFLIDPGGIRAMGLRLR